MIKNKTFSIVLLFVMLAALIPLPSQYVAAQEEPPTTEHLDIQQNGTAVRDTYMQTPNNVGFGGSNNHGSENVLHVGKSASFTARSMLLFDFSGLPFDSSITVATLKLKVQSETASSSNTIELYALKRDFNESNYNWDRWGPDSIANAWTTAGGMGSNDILPEVIGSATIGANPSAGDVIEIPITEPQAVTAMIRGDLYGFLIKLQTESADKYVFYSSDAATATDRPMLSVDYVPDGAFFAGVPTWECVASSGYGCEPPTSLLEKSIWTNESGGGNWGYGDPDAATTGNSGKIEALYLNCYAATRCWNDFPIYYKFTYDVAWTTGGASRASLYLTFDIPGGTNVTRRVACGAGAHYNCKGVIEGYITADKLPANSSSAYLIGYQARLVFPATWPVLGTQFTWQYEISLEPFDQDCADAYMTPQPSTFVIDETIETPLGSLGTPADDQIYDTEIGTTYMVFVENEWNDGTPSVHTDAAVSIDEGETWMNWSEFKGTAVCVDYLPTTQYEPDYWIVYFTATTESFWIRANDTAGDFANNYIGSPPNYDAPPFQYTMGISYLLAETECGAQFTYDPVEDWLLSAVLYGTNPDALVNDANESQHMQAGEWYAIEVASGAWNEPGGDGRIDMEYLFEGLTGVEYNEFEDLADGGQYVTCVADNIVYVQAPAELLHLRVNDQDSNFANNLGYLGINIYHAAFTRQDGLCEISFALDDLVRSDSVDAKQSNGKVFALTVGSTLTNTNTQTENFLSSGLVPGAWYALETTGGPWGHLGPGKAPAPVHYSLAVAESGVGQTPTTWTPLEDWERAECNIESDTLGHRLVYFQMPVTGAVQFSLRVNDFEDWNNNTGEMSWNLYRVIDLGPQDSGVCDYSFNPEENLNGVVLTVQANAVDGAYIGTHPTPGEPVGTYDSLEPNTYYAVEILDDFVWYDAIGADPSTEAELSLNNGTTWGDIPGGGELCTVQQGGNTIFFIHTPATATPQYKMRVNSTTFADNAGFLGYNIYLAEAGTSIDPYDSCVTEGYTTTTLGPYEWIPVTDPMGINVASNSASYAEISGLVPGNQYIIETSRGPWFDGESTYEDGRPQEFYGAEVSSDGGVTWLPMNGNNGDVTCWEFSPDFKYYKIEFTVQPGQVWRIRVADSTSATFTDNTGNLAYTLKGMVQPADTAVQGTFTLAGCNTPPVFPGLLDISDILNLGNYLAEWFDYATGSIVKFFAWCPSNTDMVTMFAEDINDKDPFAFFDEMDGVLNDIKNEINGYDWGSEATDYSVLTKSPAQASRMINQYIFGELPDDSPWINGDLVDFNAPVPQDMYSANCSLAVSDYLGPKLAQGVCFTTNWARNIGMMFYIQLLLDLGVVFAALGSIVNSFKRLIYLFTGVNLSIMKNDQKVFVNLMNDEPRGRR